MKSFSLYNKELTEEQNYYADKFGYSPSGEIVPGKGGKGRAAPKDKMEKHGRALVSHTDEKGYKVVTMIPPVQYNFATSKSSLSNALLRHVKNLGKSVTDIEIHHAHDPLFKKHLGGLL